MKHSQIMANASTSTLPSQNDGCRSTQTYSRRERDDNYRSVIVWLAPRWRVIVCKDSIQFILQKRSVAPPNTGTWAGKSFSTTRDGLMAPCSERGLLSEPSARQVMEALPSDVRDYVIEPPHS